MRLPFRRRRLADGLALLSLLAAFVLTHLPPNALRALAREGREAPLADAVWVDDKLIHVLIYVAPGFWCALAVALRGRLDLRGAALVLASLAACAVVDELTQGLLDRVTDPADVLANLLGAAIGLAPVLVVARCRS